jgi:hypothetical protein
MKLLVFTLFLLFGLGSSSLVSDIKCSQIDYVYQNSNCCKSGANSAHCLKQIAQADLEGELDAINLKIDKLQFGGMTVQQSAVLQIGTNAAGVADKKGTLRVEDAGSIEIMSGGKIDVKDGATLDVSGASVLGLGGTASGDAVSIGFMSLTGIEGDAKISGQFSINGGLKMDGDRVSIEDNTGNIESKGSLKLGGSIEASSLDIDTDKFNIDVTGNVKSKGSYTSSGDVKLHKLSGETTLAMDAASGSLTADGYAHIKDRLIVDGVATFNKGINIDNKVMVADGTGNTEIIGDVKIAGKTTATGGIDISGPSNVAAGATLKISGILDVSQGQLIGQYVTATNADISQLTGTLDHNNHAHSNVNLQSGKINNVVIGDTAPSKAAFLGLSASDLLVSANITSATIDVTGEAKLGSAVLSGTISGASDITATGKVTSGTLQTGDATMNNFTASGLANLDGGLKIDSDKLVVDKTGNVQTKGTIEAEGKIQSAGLDLVGASLQIATTDVTVDKIFSIDHSTGDLETSGSITASQDAIINGSTSVGATLDVTGMSSLDGGLNIADNFTVDASSGKIMSSDGLYTQKSSSLKGLLVSADGTQGLTVDSGAESKLNGGIKVMDGTNETFSVATDGSITASGLSSLNGGIAVSNKFSVNSVGQAVASSLVVAGSRLPEFQEREAVDCSAFAADSSPSSTTAGDGNIIILSKGRCAKKFERYVCGSALTTGADNIVSEAEFLAHDDDPVGNTGRVCAGVFAVDLVDTCVTTVVCDTDNPCDPVTGAATGGVDIVAGGQYCRALDTREKCEGNNLFGDSGTYDQVSDKTRTPMAWTTQSLEIHMCTSTTASVKN